MLSYPKTHFVNHSALLCLKMNTVMNPHYQFRLEVEHCEVLYLKIVAIAPTSSSKEKTMQLNHHTVHVTLLQNHKGMRTTFMKGEISIQLGDELPRAGSTAHFQWFDGRIQKLVAPVISLEGTVGERLWRWIIVTSSNQKIS